MATTVAAICCQMENLFPDFPVGKFSWLGQGQWDLCGMLFMAAKKEVFKQNIAY